MLKFLIISSVFGILFAGFMGSASASATARFIAQYESFVSCPYKDSGGWSVGYGQLAKSKRCISQKEAMNTLEKSSSRITKKVEKKFSFLTENQKTALVSFAYNTPNTHPLFSRNDLEEAIKNKDKNKMTAIFLEYAPYRGNEIRRKAEIDLFFFNYEQNTICTLGYMLGISSDTLGFYHPRYWKFIYKKMRDDEEFGEERDILPRGGMEDLV